MHIRLSYSGRNYDQAAALPDRIELPNETPVSQALASLRAALPPSTILADTCLVAVSGVHLGTVRTHQDRMLHDGEELLLIAPVAGG